MGLVAASTWAEGAEGLSCAICGTDGTIDHCSKCDDRVRSYCLHEEGDDQVCSYCSEEAAVDSEWEEADFMQRSAKRPRSSYARPITVFSSRSSASTGPVEEDEWQQEEEEEEQQEEEPAPEAVDE